MSRKPGTVPIRTLIDDYITAGPRGTAAALARLLEVKEPTISRWRHGQDVPEESRAAEIARAIDRDPGEVLAAITAGKIEKQANRGRASNLQSEVARLREMVEKLDIRGDEPQ